MVATSGDVLLAPEAVDALKSELVPLATLITPNLPEAAILLGRAHGRQRSRDRRTGRKRCAPLGCRCSARQGRPRRRATTPWTCWSGRQGVEPFVRPRVATPHTHGTGCTLSAAIAALLAQGVALAEAVDRAKAYVWQGVAGMAARSVSEGAGARWTICSLFAACLRLIALPGEAATLAGLMAVLEKRLCCMSATISQRTDGRRHLLVREAGSLASFAEATGFRERFGMNSVREGWRPSL